MSVRMQYGHPSLSLSLYNMFVIFLELFTYFYLFLFIFTFDEWVNIPFFFKPFVLWANFGLRRQLIYLSFFLSLSLYISYMYVQVSHGHLLAFSCKNVPPSHSSLRSVHRVHVPIVASHMPCLTFLCSNLIRSLFVCPQRMSQGFWFSVFVRIWIPGLFASSTYHSYTNISLILEITCHVGAMRWANDLTISKQLTQLSQLWPDWLSLNYDFQQ